jgi:hypothetical protein
MRKGPAPHETNVRRHVEDFLVEKLYGQWR